jgi:hypothetical protein
VKLNVESYLARRFDLARQNCWHVLRDAWLELTGTDLGDRTPERLSRAALVGRFDSDVPAFQELAKPGDPCIVLMRHAGQVPHVGLHWRRRVLQMSQRGPSYLPLHMATVGYDVGFYIPTPEALA